MSKMSAKAILGHEFKQIRQPLSGYVLGWERENAWRIIVSIGAREFVSARTYPSRDSAVRAAKTIERSTIKSVGQP